MVVTTNGIDCAGQFVVTALGEPLPSVLVQTVPFIIGPASGSNDVAGGILSADGVGNDWKISASCNGARPNQAAFAFKEFFVEH